MGNLDLYERVREVPESAKKKILGGRLKGMTDINPMWRIKTLTEVFGVCGDGWKYEILKSNIIDAGEEKAAFVEINLFYKKADGAWSDPIPGTGGSMFITKERGGIHVDDECFKKSLTDAISVACKALGIGADVYWNSDRTKYTQPEAKPQQKRTEAKQQQEKSDAQQLLNRAHVTALEKMCAEKGVEVATICRLYKVENLSQLMNYQFENITSHWKEIIEVQNR